jgi:hypothetical protein
MPETWKEAGDFKQTLRQTVPMKLDAICCEKLAICCNLGCGMWVTTLNSYRFADQNTI